jgi:probable F420-dependent oxidoreductase
VDHEVLARHEDGLGVKVGLFSGVTDETIAPAVLGRAAEDRGFESLFVADHSHVPVRRETPYPYNSDGVLARSNYRVMDPFVTLAAVAAVTRWIRLGTGVALVAQRDPIVLAKEVATLDVVSNGRVELGVGSGWLREEMRNHGTDPRNRVAILGERVRAMKRIWSSEEAEFHGTFVDFDPIYSWPKPVQTPHPPVLVGGWGPSTFQRVLEYGDAWMAPVGLSLDRLAEGTKSLNAAAADLGREGVPVTATIIPGPGVSLGAYEALGVDRLLLFLGSGREDETFRELDILAGMVGVTAP